MKENNQKPRLAPAMKELLEKSATRGEKEKGKTTRVTHLSYDEVDPS